MGRGMKVLGNTMDEFSDMYKIKQSINYETVSHGDRDKSWNTHPHDSNYEKALRSKH